MTTPTPAGLKPEDERDYGGRTVPHLAGSTWLAPLWWNPYILRIDCDVAKTVQWVGSSKADLKRFPDPVRRRMGFAIHLAQVGLRHRDAKPLKGFGSGVLEIAARHDGDTFRAVYTVRIEAVYILHAFQKKSARGVRTAKRELDLTPAG